MKKTSVCLFLWQTSSVESDLGHMLLYYHWPKHIPRKSSQPVQQNTNKIEIHVRYKCTHNKYCCD